MHLELVAVRFDQLLKCILLAQVAAIHNDRHTVATRGGTSKPASAAANDSSADRPSALPKPALNISGDPNPPLAANTVPPSAIPNAPPRNRNMLYVPDALPISVGPTELSTAFCAAGIARETPAPASTS